MPKSDVLHRAAIVTPCCGRIDGSLPRRTQSPGSRKPIDPDARGGDGMSRRNPPPRAARWNAKLLLPPSGVSSVDRVFGYYGLARADRHCVVCLCRRGGRSAEFAGQPRPLCDERHRPTAGIVRAGLRLEHGESSSERLPRVHKLQRRRPRPDAMPKTHIRIKRV
jgi:hypothetical protein